MGSDIRPEALRCYDEYFAAIMPTLLSQYANVSNVPENCVDMALVVADDIAHKMVLTRYKRIAKGHNENNGIDYSR